MVGLIGLFTGLGTLVALQAVPGLLLALLALYLLSIGGQVHAPSCGRDSVLLTSTADAGRW